MDVALVFLPLAGAIIAGLFGRIIGDRGAQWVTCGFMLVSAVLAVVAFVDVIYNGIGRDSEGNGVATRAEFGIGEDARVIVVVANLRPL